VRVASKSGRLITTTSELNDSAPGDQFSGILSWAECASFSKDVSCEVALTATLPSWQPGEVALHDSSSLIHSPSANLVS